MGDATRDGLRDARRLDTRLTDRALIGAGDTDISRRYGVMGSVEEGRDVRPWADDLRNGVWRELDLYLSKSLVLVLVVHRGLLANAGGRAGVRGTGLRAAGVGVAATCFVGEVTPSDALGIADFFAVKVDVTCGNPEYRRTFDMVVRATELTELPRRLELLTGVVDRFNAFAGVMMTDEAGELPGVSGTLPVSGLSMVRILEIESRRC